MVDPYPRAAVSLRRLLLMGTAMFGRNQVSDKDLLKSVNQRLTRSGGSQARVTVAVQQGTVTLTGTLQYAIQRIPIIKEVGRVAGVSRVVDLMTLVERKTS
jgi:osmotically-inducible protein OsmY